MKFTVKCWKVDFLVSSKTRSGEISREKFRMVRALVPDTHKPNGFQPKYKFFSNWYRSCGFPVFASSGVGKWLSGVGNLDPICFQRGLHGSPTEASMEASTEASTEVNAMALIKREKGRRKEHSHPICHQMAPYGSWEDFDQTNLDDCSARVFDCSCMFANFAFCLARGRVGYPCHVNIEVAFSRGGWKSLQDNFHRIRFEKQVRLLKQCA